MAKERKEEQSFDQEALSQLHKIESYIQENNKLLYGAFAAVVLLAVAYFFYKDNAETNELNAQKEIFTAQYFYAKDSVNLVLSGDGNNVIGVEEIANEYSSTEAGNLAKFYTGERYLRKGDFEAAIDYLDSFSSSDLLVQSRAYSLIGDANMELGEYEEAISYYKKASNHYPNEFFTPKYLTKLALAYQKAGDSEKTLEAYREIIQKFPKSAEANNAKKYSALLSASI